MMDNSKQQNQMRFFLAAALSMMVLFGWSYFFAPPKPETDNANTAQTENVNAAQTAQTQQSQTATPTTPNQTVETANVPDNVPGKVVTIKSPLYEVKFDSKGALATSWILLKNKTPHGEKPLYADGSNASNEKPLQLISERALAQISGAVVGKSGHTCLGSRIGDRVLHRSSRIDPAVTPQQ